MKISKMPLPFKVNNGMLTDASGYHIAASCELASELCDILNAHFAPKEEALCIHGVRPDHFCAKCQMQQPIPQPNREETDRVAMEFIKSERTIQPQYWEDGQWHNAVIGEGVLPPFDYGLPWRIKPTKRRVVVEVYRDSTSADCLRSVCVGSEDASQFWTLVGTIEGEVEA